MKLYLNHLTALASAVQELNDQAVPPKIEGPESKTFTFSHPLADEQFKVQIRRDRFGLYYVADDVLVLAEAEV